LIVRWVPFQAEQIARLNGSRRLQTIRPEQLQMALGAATNCSIRSCASSPTSS
jgi:hypothetical protein